MRLSSARQAMPSNHTPGPWFVVPHKEGLGIACEQPNGMYWIADVIENQPVGASHHANANLMAAAPRLLEALHAILFQVIQGKVLERDACIEQARAAYAYATAAEL